MAAKDSQGLQAIVIVLVILVILLGAGLIFVNNAKKTAQARANEADNRASDAQSAHAKANQEANEYKVAIGFSEGDAYESVQKTIAEDLEQFGKNFEDENRAYRKILAANDDELRNAAKNEAEAKEQVKNLSAKINAVEAEASERVKVALAELQKAKDDMASEHNKFEAQYEEFKRDSAEISQQLEDEREKHEALQGKLNAEIKRLQTRKDDLTRANTLLRSNQIEADPFAQPADGKVTWVNQRFAKAWINVGEADGLRPQVTFSVYAPNELDATNAVKKASIEVVRVVEPHLSEVRITEDDPKDPLVPGDQIYSQVWDRGRKLGFAIAGRIDLDNDDRDDLDLLKRIIVTNNGRIDAAPGEESDMSVQTRFLVLGKFPTGSAPGVEALQQHWNETAEKADDLNIETIAADEFVKLMGWRSENKSVALGSTARPSDFPAGAREQELPRKTGAARGTFRKRLPPTPY